MVDRYLLGGTATPAIDGQRAIAEVESVQALLTLAVPDADVIVHAPKYYTASAAPDGGGGEFQWVAASTATHNAGTVILPTGQSVGTPGRWLRIYEGFDLCAEWFGALGDNSTTNTTALQAALTAINANGGGRLLFGDGIFLTDGLTVYADTEIVGCGQGVTTVKRIASGTANMFVVTAGDDNTAFRSMTMNGNEANQGIATYSTCIRTTGSTGVIVDDVYFTAGGDRAIDIRSSSQVSITNCRFVNTGIANPDANGGNAISVDINGTDRSTDVVVTGNYFENFGDTAIGIPHTKRATVSNNVIRGATDIGGTPLSTEAGISLNACEDTVCDGNVLRKVKAKGIALLDQTTAGTHYPVKNVVVSNNTLISVSGHETNINFVADSNTNGNSTGVIIQGNVGDGTTDTVSPFISVGGGYCRDFAILGNYMRVDAQTASQKGILLSGAGPDNYNISGNTVVNFYRGIELQANVGSAGIVSSNTVINAFDDLSQVNIQNSPGPMAFGNLNYRYFLQGAALRLAEGVNIQIGTVTGTKIGTATTAKIGFWGNTPVVRTSAYTQTYSTATRTHSNLTSATLTDNSAGTADATVQALADGTTYANDVAAIRNNFADLAAQINALRVDLVNAKGVVNQVIDDAQSYGLLQ